MQEPAPEGWESPTYFFRREAVIAALGEHFSPEETAIVERMCREYGGTIPDAQLVEEIGLAVAAHRRHR